MGFDGRPRWVAVSETSGGGGAAAVLPINRPLPLISRPWFGARVRPRVQAASGPQSGDGATVAYPLRRLRRKKMAVAKPTMPKMAPYEEGSGMGARLVTRNPKRLYSLVGSKL